jgi:hypothetical protein
MECEVHASQVEILRPLASILPHSPVLLHQVCTRPGIESGTSRGRGVEQISQTPVVLPAIQILMMLMCREIRTYCLMIEINLTSYFLNGSKRGYDERSARRQQEKLLGITINGC